MIKVMSPSPLVGMRVTQLPAELQPRAVRRGTVVGDRIELLGAVEEVVEAIESDAEGQIASWRTLEPARSAQDGEIARSPASMIKEAQKRFWDVSATIARAVGPARRKIEGAFQVIDVEITSLKVVFTSPMDDVIVAVWTTPTEPSGKAGTSEVKAWAHTRGVTRPLDIATAKKWITGPWEGLMENSGFVPAWKRELIEEAKRKAKPGVCSGCGASVLVGLDQGVWEPAGLTAIVDAEPLGEAPLRLLAEVACFFGGRKVYTLFGLGKGIELASRDDYSIGWTKYPIHVEHRCGDPIELAA